MAHENNPLWSELSLLNRTFAIVGWIFGVVVVVLTLPYFPSTALEAATFGKLFMIGAAIIYLVFVLARLSGY